MRVAPISNKQAQPPELLIRANALLRKLVYRSPWVTRVLFQAWPPTAVDEISYFELGSLAMQRALAADLRDGMRVAEVGTGPYAVMALWATARWKLSVVATELEARWAASAAARVEAAGASIEVHCADLLEGIQGPFDAIFFVPPFIAEQTFNEELALAKVDDPEQQQLLRLRSCGGPEGWELIARFYEQATPRLAAGGRCYVVINRYQQQVATIEALAEQRGQKTLAVVRLGPLPFSVIVSEARGAAS